MGRLDQKVALVTGAGQGVGQGVAFALARDGASVAVVGRTEAKLIDTCDQIKEAGGLSLPVVCDVTDPEQVIACVDEVVDHYGRLDILINNAQVYKKNTMLESNDDEVYEAFDSGPMAAYRFMRKAYPQLKEHKGVIVNMGSGAQLLHEGMRFGSYMAAKYAMLAFTRTAAVEWGKDGIRAYLVMPAAWTPMSRESQRQNPEQLERLISTIPMGRMGDAEIDIGRPVCWLCTDEAGFMTGTTVQLDGGQLFLH
jgi:NAD(P)-dependent dehydrogenase (short-subunit alcohol dehydrogenase family)